MCDDMGLVEAVRPPARVVLEDAYADCPEHGVALRNGKCGACAIGWAENDSPADWGADRG